MKKEEQRKRFLQLLDDKETEVSLIGDKDDFFLSSFTLA